MTLIEHIKKLNDETLAWVAEDPKHRMAGTLCDNEKHWNDYGVYTAEDLDKYLLVSSISDVHKDVYGCRPRHLDFDNMTIEELKDYLNDLTKYNSMEN